MKIKMTSPKNISDRNLLIGIASLILLGVLIFNVFYFSTYYGFVQVNYLNSLLIIPFIVLIFSFGIVLGHSRHPELILKTDDYNLSSREKEIIQLITKGKKNKEIAETLFVELSTIKSHINNIYKKIRVKNRRELVRKVLAERFYTSEE